jgi:hypothetical protein
MLMPSGSDTMGEIFANTFLKHLSESMKIYFGKDIERR